MNIRRAALLVPAIVLLAACSSQADTTSKPASSAPASSAASAEASASTEATDTVDPEEIAMSLSQQMMGYAAEQSRATRKVPADDPDPMLFNYLKEDPASWVEGAKYLADEAKAQQVTAEIDGTPAERVTSSTLKLSDGLTIVVAGGEKVCTVKATFVDAGEMTGMAWEGPTCDGGSSPSPEAS